MKFQHLAVIFIIIILPISLVLSVYTGNLIKISNREAAYNALLLNSTYDAVRAYQMNNLNNNYSTNTASKLRDINGSINSFFSSLATGLSTSGYTKNELKSYVPAMLYTLYDGYYVYGCYKNVASVSDGKPKYSESSSIASTEYGLKSYVYYSCEYKKINTYDLIINYTLDNFISVCGTYYDSASGTMKYISDSGYYINTNGITEHNDKSFTIVKGTKTTNISPETLGEYISTTDNYHLYENINGINTIVNGTRKNDTNYYNYITYKGAKYYYDDNNCNIGPATKQLIGNRTINISFNDSYDGVPIFRLENNLRIYINNNELNDIASYMGVDTSDLISKNKFQDIGACNYYKNALAFSTRVSPIISQINVNTAITDTYNLNYVSNLKDKDINQNKVTHQKTTYENENIFDTSKPANDPELESSSFNMHRIDVIVSSIESSLVNAMENFNDYVGSNYEYALPILSEEDWYTIANNITTVSFLQGLTIGNYKYYTDYSVVANTKNNDFVSKNAIYVQNDYQANGVIDMSNLYVTSKINGTTEATYHNPRCSKFNNENPSNVIAYKNTEYDRNSFTYKQQEYYSNGGTTVYLSNPENAESTENYYMQAGSSGYECIVSQNDVTFTTDELISGNNNKINDNVRNAYIIGLAREREALYERK